MQPNTGERFKTFPWFFFYVYYNFFFFTISTQLPNNFFVNNFRKRSIVFIQILIYQLKT